MGQNFAKIFRGIFQGCTRRTSSNESLTNVSSLFGTRTLNSDTSIFSSTATSFPEVAHLSEIQEEDGILDEKALQMAVDVNSNSSSNLSQWDMQDVKDNRSCFSEPFSLISPISEQQISLHSSSTKNSSSQSLNTESCTFSDTMCASFFTRMSRSLSSLTGVIEDTSDIFHCPCILCTGGDHQIPYFATIYDESKFVESPNSSSTDTSTFTSSNSENSKTTSSISGSDSTQPSDNTSSLCRSDTLSATCMSKNSHSSSSMPTTSSTCTGSSSYSSGSSGSSSRSSNIGSSCSSSGGSGGSSTDSTNSTTRSSSSEISLGTLFGST